MRNSAHLLTLAYLFIQIWYALNATYQANNKASIWYEAKNIR